MTPGRFSALLPAAAALAALALGGCSTPSTSIDVDDSGMLVPSARASFSLTRSEKPPSLAQDGRAIEIGVSSAEGTGTQSLAAGQPPIFVGDQTFNGPLQLRYEFDWLQVQVAHRWRFFNLEGNLGFETLAGASYWEFGLTATAPGQRGSRRYDNGGFLLGVGAIWNLLPRTSLQARFTASSNLFESTASRLEVFAAQALGRNAALRAGYSHWRFNTDAGNSDVEAKFHGPMLGLDLMF